MDELSMDKSSMDESPMEDSDVHGWNVTDEGSPIPGASSTDGASSMEERRRWRSTVDGLSMDGLVIGFDTGER